MNEWWPRRKGGSPGEGAVEGERGAGAPDHASMSAVAGTQWTNWPWTAVNVTGLTLCV